MARAQRVPLTVSYGPNVGGWRLATRIQVYRAAHEELTKRTRSQPARDAMT